MCTVRWQTPSHAPRRITTNNAHCQTRRHPGTQRQTRTCSRLPPLVMPNVFENVETVAFLTRTVSINNVHSVRWHDTLAHTKENKHKECILSDDMTPWHAPQHTHLFTPAAIDHARYDENVETAADPTWHCYRNSTNLPPLCSMKAWHSHWQ